MLAIGTLALVGLFVASAAIPAPTPGRPHLLVIVRTEGLAALNARLTERALSSARDIWRPYADVTFATETESTRGRSAGEERLDLVITNRTRQANGGTGLGWIAFVNGAPAGLITVSSTAATRLMETSKWGDRPLTTLPPTIREAVVARIMALSIAHEIGHYLLKSPQHTQRGLMRAVVKPTEIVRLSAGDLRLNREDVQRLGHTVPYLSASAAHAVGDVVD